ncbi:hypothetical protein Acr_00g0006600 [Actinidia rufa]|uniref:Uncharacterized protein n=1 Tax=Actinidia rufa TaxID=165716 RepID=A0A7J0D833_9ERIC|nr:hypothetical protein Acr_00g0006600 [Actinidia rufa]
MPRTTCKRAPTLDACALVTFSGGAWMPRALRTTDRVVLTAVDHVLHHRPHVIFAEVLCFSDRFCGCNRNCGCPSNAHCDWSLVFDPSPYVVTATTTTFAASGDWILDISAIHLRY